MEADEEGAVLGVELLKAESAVFKEGVVGLLRLETGAEMENEDVTAVGLVRTMSVASVEFEGMGAALVWEDESCVCDCVVEGVAVGVFKAVDDVEGINGFDEIARSVEVR